MRGSALAFAALGLLLASGCSSPTDVPDAPLGTARISILDADEASRQYMLYVRRATGEWFHGGGKDAFGGDAPRPMEFTDEDRERIADLMDRAGWTDGSVDLGSGTGPRYLEVSLSGSLPRARFTMLATDGGFDPETEAVLSALRTVVERGYRGVLDALPQARPSGP